MPRSPGQVRLFATPSTSRCVSSARFGPSPAAGRSEAHAEVTDQHGVFRFDRFAFDPTAGELFSGSDVVPIARKPAELLHVLLRHRDRIVSKREILEMLWPGIRVSDAAFASALRDLRRALGDTGRQSRYVATLRARGLRFLAPVEMAKTRRADAAPSAPSRAFVGRAELLERLSAGSRCDAARRRPRRAAERRAGDRQDPHRGGARDGGVPARCAGPLRALRGIRSRSPVSAVGGAAACDRGARAPPIARRSRGRRRRAHPAGAGRRRRGAARGRRRVASSVSSTASRRSCARSRTTRRWSWCWTICTAPIAVRCGCSSSWLRSSRARAC